MKSLLLNFSVRKNLRLILTRLDKIISKTFALQVINCKLDGTKRKYGKETANLSVTQLVKKNEKIT